VLEDGNNTTNIDDIIETINHFKLVDYMLDNADKTLSEDIIKEFHKILKTGTSDERKSWFNVGEYKSLANEVGGNETSKPENVKMDMNQMVKFVMLVHLENIQMQIQVENVQHVPQELIIIKKNKQVVLHVQINNIKLQQEKHHVLIVLVFVLKNYVIRKLENVIIV
jgi:hypothetical protein